MKKYFSFSEIVDKFNFLGADAEKFVQRVRKASFHHKRSVRVPIECAGHKGEHGVWVLQLLFDKSKPSEPVSLSIQFKTWAEADNFSGKLFQQAFEVLLKNASSPEPKIVRMNLVGDAGLIEALPKKPRLFLVRNPARAVWDKMPEVEPLAILPKRDSHSCETGPEIKEVEINLHEVNMVKLGATAGLPLSAIKMMVQAVFATDYTVEFTKFVDVIAFVQRYESIFKQFGVVVSHKLGSKHLTEKKKRRVTLRVAS